MAAENGEDDDDNDGEKDEWEEIEGEADGEDDEEGWADMEKEEEEEEEKADEEMEEEDIPLKAAAEVDDEKCPTLVPIGTGEGEPTPSLTKLTTEERDSIRRDVSSTRIFSTEDFTRMAKLVQREEAAKRDPRLMAKRRRAGDKFEPLSDDDDSSSDEDEGVRIRGQTEAGDLLGSGARRRKSRAEKLERIQAGREKYEHGDRRGGSTNEEKKRKKNFLMSKNSRATRDKMGDKATRRQNTTGGRGKENFKGANAGNARKRRRKN
mmetsp:Transcript_33175/g.76537  ORF Transcript_33175/g.76537 Transcript_33175/m.76537 type:complete len:265 (+) Transcript_33175:1254-2048(+)